GTKSWHLKLAEFAIIRGANIRTIAEAFSKPLIVALTELCIAGEWASLLSLAWDRITSAEYDATDSDGNTAMHVYVKSPKRSTNQAIVLFHELGKKGCLTFLPDRHGKIPLHYVTKQDNCYFFLEQAEAVCRDGRLRRLKLLHDEGNKAWKESRCVEAIQFYNFAILIARVYNQDSLSVLYSNVAAAYLAINDFTNALEAAEKCLEGNPSFFKGYFRKGQALVKLNDNVKACETYITGFTKATDAAFKCSFAEEAIKVLDTIPAKARARLVLRWKTLLSDSWLKILEYITQNKKWELLSLLMLGPPFESPDSAKQGIMGNCDVSSAVLSTFLPTFFESAADTDRMSALLLKLLKQGAAPDKLSLPEETHYHSLVRFCISARNTDVLEWILENCSTKEIQSAKDKDNRTPLHTLCLEQEKRKENNMIYMKIAEILLTNGVPKEAADKVGQPAQEYALKGSNLQTFIRNYAKQATEPSSTRNSTRKTQEVKVESKRASPEPNISSGEKDWKTLKQEGTDAYAKNNYEKAKLLYTEAIISLENELQKKVPNLMLINLEDGHNLAILYGNRAECWYKMGDKIQFLEDAKKNVDYDGNWYKGHQRVGRAFKEKGNPKSAVKAFTNAYKMWKPSDGEKNRLAILSDLVDCAYELKMDPSNSFQNVPISNSAWAKLAYEYLKKKDWLKAEFSESLACNSQFRHERFDPTDINLAHLCDEKKLKQHYKWICRLLMFFLKYNVDHTTLKFHPEDTFFHAVIAISLMNPIPPIERKYLDDSLVLLFHVMDSIISPQKLQNLTDAKGNTVLHSLAILKGSDPMRQYLAHYLVEKGVNVMARNKDNALAYDLTKSNDIVRYVLQSYMDKEAAIIKVAEKQKEEESRNKKQQKKETAKGDTGTKKATVSASEVKPKVQEKPLNNIKPDETDKLKKEKTLANAASKKLCDFCEKKLEDALEYQKEEEYEKAYLQLVEVINIKKHGTDPRHKNLKQQSLTRIATLLSYADANESPKSLIKNISSDGIVDVINELAQTRKWIQLEKFVAHVKDNDRGKALTDFAKSINLQDVIDEPSLDGLTDSKISIIDLLLSYGAKLDKTTSITALNHSMAKSDWMLVVKLLKMGANPKGVSLNPKDTPNHAALLVGLSLDPGNFTILEELRSIYVREKDKSGYGYLSESCKDGDGNTLLHLAAQAKFSPHSLRAVELLCEWQVPADVCNNVGKLPVDYLTSRTDRRAQYIKVTMSSDKRGGTASNVARQKSTTKNHPVTDGTKNVYHKYREEVAEILKEIPDVFIDYLKPEEENDKQSEEEESEEEEEEDTDSYADESRIEFEDDNMDEDNTILVSGEEESELNFDVKAFDNMAWDVECTEDVWNMLRSRREKRAPNEETTEDNPQKKSKKEKIPIFVKKIIVKYIYQLAKGDWRPHLQRRVKGIPDTLQLFKIKLPLGICLLWELAVAFSPRLSETAENLLAMEPGVEEDVALSKGRVYSELIRVWNVVLKSSDVEHFVRKIVRSHQRGKECIIQKKLIGLNSTDTPQTSTCDRFPSLYIETSSSRSDISETQFEKSYFPPASAHRNEFHILKFYSFSSTLVSAVLSSAETKIDFPFRVTDIEHAIISLDSNTPLLLLGRSGTGKTTCCLYRLWGMFLCYWEQAMKFNSPLLPRKLPEFLEHENVEGDEAVSKETKTDQGDLADSCSLVDELDEDDETEEGENDILYEHLHQLFVTKNPVLCTEVEKNFLKLRHASTILHMHNTAPNKVLPNTLQEVDDVCFPLFLTSRQLLLMLDASIDGEPFFPRNEDLALKVAIPGWGTQEDIFNIAPLIHEFFDSSDEDDDEELPKKAKNPHAHGTRGQVKVDPRRECTYEVFAFQVWPKVAKKVQLDCYASLAWTEIMSFIKGSYEALNTENGYLNKTQYLDLGRKRAPNFSGDRAKIYEAFLLFNNYKQQHFLFDEADLVFKLYTRLRTMTYIPWTLHEIYVDETQDFTQAELALLVSLGHDPNKMFLTGDTAQSIMRGISFRFIDLKSLFYYAKESARENEKYLASIKVPQKVHQLRYNYRSHTGILSLASSVLDILIEFFPESFDPLKKDQGMFAGPKPVVIESCSPGDLALLLTGNRRKTSHIEFGAHQAILVVNEGAKEKIPEELRTGIVLTIYESKGLEFDDILIYNFFKDSQANKEWRVVTTFLENLVTRVKHEDDTRNLVEIKTDLLSQTNRPRALAFDPNQHKLLNSELKHLYTALTRARVNVWIFDEDEEKRAPMFEYFKALNLVKCMEVGDSENITEELMFADSSSPHEWKQAGDNYMKQRLYHVAAKCYSKALQPEKVKLALAYQTALEASKLKASPREMREKYLSAGVQFLKCGGLYKAAICFQNAKEILLAAQTYEKNGQFEEAASQYRKLQDSKYVLDESSCLEKVGMFGRAVQVLQLAKHFDRAMDCLTRYKMQVKKFKNSGRPVPLILLDNKPSLSEENLCFSAARHHHENKEHSKAIAAMRRVKDIGSQIDFFKNHGYFAEAAELMMKEGKTEEAATLMLRNGHTDKALAYSTDGMNKQQTAFINLVLARKYETNFDQENIKKHAKRALNIYIDLGDYDGQAQAKLILGKHTLEEKLLKSAHNDFDMKKPPNDIGRLESLAAFIEVKSAELTIEECKKCVNCVKQALTVIQNLYDTKGNKSEQLLSYLKFYGFDLDVVTQKVSWYPNEYPYCQSLLGINKEEETAEVQIKTDRQHALTAIRNHVMSWIKSWSKKVKQQLALLLPKHTPCRNFLEGLKCTDQDCQYRHQHIATLTEEKDILNIHTLAVSLDHYLQTGLDKLEGTDCETLKEELSSLNDVTSQWDTVKRFLDYSFPTSVTATRENEDLVKNLVSQIRSSKVVVNQIQRYFRFLWDNPGRVGKGKSRNVVKERCKTSDWIVQASFFSTLFNFEHFNVRKEVQDLENQLRNNFKHWTKKYKKYALFSPVQSAFDGEMMVETIGSRFIESLDWLKDHDPLEAAFAFSKMISTLGRRNVLSLMPKPEHLIFWMEFYFTVTWFFIGNSFVQDKNKPNFVLSNSLLATVYLVNASLAKDGGKTNKDKIQQLITQYSSSQSKRLYFREEHYCNFLVGQNEFSGFSLIALFNDLCSGAQPQYQLAERVLILSLCTLLNIPLKFVSSKYEAPIRRELFKLTVTDTLPAPLKTLINTVNKASGYLQIATALFVYIRSRKNLKIFQCQWVARDTCPMLYEEMTSYPNIPLTTINLQELAQTERAETEEKEDADALDEEDIQKMEAKKVAAEQEKSKKTAIQRIIKALRFNLMKMKLKKKSYRDFELKEMFRPFTLSHNFCGVCGIELGTEIGQPLEDGEPLTILTKEVHSLDQSHRIALKELDTFYQIYDKQIYYELDKIERFLLQRKVEENSEIYADILIDVTKVLSSLSSFRKLLADVLAKRAWTDRASVLEAFRTLQEDFKEKGHKIDAQFQKASNKSEENEDLERQETGKDIIDNTEGDLLDFEGGVHGSENPGDDYRPAKYRSRNSANYYDRRNNPGARYYRQKGWHDNRSYERGHSSHRNGRFDQTQVYQYRADQTSNTNYDNDYHPANNRRQNYRNFNKGDYSDDQRYNYHRPGRNFNNGQRGRNRNREEFLKNAPPRFQKQFMNG
ncbi:TPR and ankyrin repeat-containing protein 1, partial [Biomphalaria glabrata]